MTAAGQVITPPAAAGTFFLPAVPRPRIWVPMLLAFAVEALILAVSVLWLARHPPPPAVSPQFGPIRLDLTKLPTPEPAPTGPQASAAAKSPVPTKPAPETAKPVPKQPTRERTTALTPSREPSPPQSTPDSSPASSSDFSLSPSVDSAAAGPPLPAPPKGNGQAIDVSEFMRQVNAALHKAAHNINMMRGIKLVGRVVIAIHYRDGKAWDPRILKSSGFPTLDQSVAEATTQAKWPPPPPGLEGREIVIPVSGFFW